MRLRRVIMVAASMLALGAAPPLGGPITPSGDDPLAVPRATPTATRVSASPSIRGLGPRLASRIRRDGPEQPQIFAARGLTREDIEREGGHVGAELGPILAGTLSGAALLRLAPKAELVDAPQPLRPLLDVSRVAIGADVADQGRDLPHRYRGRGVLIATYDSGIDLRHPDLRELDGPTRVVALWDQTATGTPPAGHTIGNECTRDVLMRDQCTSNDPGGHGTHVTSIAAGNGPQFRGIAPEVGMVHARSQEYALFFETLEWFSEVSTATGLPLIANISLGGHEGPHDGTSLESQAIDAYEHLVVAAAGNEGLLPVHAEVELTTGVFRDVVLRFPTYPEPRDQAAVIDIWAEANNPLGVAVAIEKSGGMVLAQTGTVTLGMAGVTETLSVGPVALGTVQLDAEAVPNPFNGMPHIRVEVSMTRWQDEPVGPGFVVVRLTGRGRVDLWIDTPAIQEAPVSFDRDAVLETAAQVQGDTAYSVSDLATAVSAVAVSAYATRTAFPTPRGQVQTAGGSVGAIAGFSSYGPTRAPARTGPKPDLAAPGFVIVGARSKDLTEEGNGFVSPLYRASAGTSMAAPHVAGVAALILSEKTKASKFDLKQYLIGSAVSGGEIDKDKDARWGAGRIDASTALEAGLGIERTCGCTVARSGSSPVHPHRSPWSFLAVTALLALARARRRPVLRG